MSFSIEDIVDGRFKVDGVCNDTGGMGVILYVEDLENEFNERIVLKFCREESDESRKRFSREVRLLASFKGNSKIVQVLHHNTQYDPPYFVMKFYDDGDLNSLADDLKENLSLQEKVLGEMLACVAELHSRDIFHRDIKPQNFLIDGDNIVLSDFGLGLELSSTSRFTNSSVLWGTQGYFPPEFQKGGFKNADSLVDIFMMGKTIYALLTGQDPTYLVDSELPAPLYHVVEKCCDYNKDRRYQSISELRQALSMVYDVLNGKGGVIGQVYQLLTVIGDKIEEGKVKSDEVIEFIGKLGLVDKADQIKICLGLDRKFFVVMKNDRVNASLREFLNIYQVMVESGQYGWSFAENIATNMERVFNANNVHVRERNKALELSIDAAYQMNRFAAMGTCTSMIKSVVENELGLEVASTIQKKPYAFILEIEPSECKCEIVRNAIIRVNENSEPDSESDLDFDL
jgi:eukaryotic-like serine/threonine-protein kinase